MKPEQQTGVQYRTEQSEIYQSVKSANPSKQKLFQLCNPSKGPPSHRYTHQCYQTFEELNKTLNSLTSRHQVVSQDRHAEVSGQGCQGGFDAWEFLGEARGLSPKVAESTEAEDAVWVVAKYVVPAGQQVVGFN